MLAAMIEQADFGVLLSAASRAFWERLRERLAEAGCREVRPNQGYVFRALSCDTMTITSLAKQFGISKQAAVSLVDELELNGYAYRQQSAADRRIKTIHLTPVARKIVEATEEATCSLVRDISAELGPDALETTRKVLSAVVGARDSKLEAAARGPEHRRP